MTRFFPFVIVLLLFVFAPTQVSAQVAEGTVYYKIKTNMHKRLTGERARFKEMIPEFSEEETRLSFKEGKLAYSQVPEAERTARPAEESADVSIGNKQRNFRRMRGSMQSTYYTNVNDSTGRTAQNMMGQKNVILSAKKPLAWKVVGEMKMIGKYQAMKATVADSVERQWGQEGWDKRNIVAWFTPQIPVSGGPMRYGQLPGMILEMTINEDETVITFDRFEDQAPEATLFEVPDWKEVSEKKYKKMIRDRMREMRGRRGF